MNRESMWNCIEYYTSRGYTESEGRSIISAKQLAISKRKTNHAHSEATKKKISEALKASPMTEKRMANCRKGAAAAHRVKKESGFDYRTSSVRCKEYWMMRGYSEREAEVQVSLSQTRNLDYYVGRYGEEEGVIRFKQRNDRWNETMRNKTDEELERINEKRKLNCHVGIYNENTIQNITHLFFYSFVFCDTNGKQIVKYGLTKQDKLHKRWSASLILKDLYFIELPAKEAVLLESELHKTFRKTYKPEAIDTTECFEMNQSNLEILVKKVQQYV